MYRNIHAITLFLLVWGLLLAAMASAFSQEHQHPEPALPDHDYYQGLNVPTGGSCCNERDCHTVADSDIRITAAEGIEILDGDEWLPVPEAAILVDAPGHPSGHAVACIGGGGPMGGPMGGGPTQRFVRCFVMPGMV